MPGSRQFDPFKGGTAQGSLKVMRGPAYLPKPPKRPEAATSQGKIQYGHAFQETVDHVHALGEIRQAEAELKKDARRRRERAKARLETRGAKTATARKTTRTGRKTTAKKTAAKRSNARQTSRKSPATGKKKTSARKTRRSR